MSFEEFLEEIGCTSELIQTLQDEKIDCSTILMMSEDDLMAYFPKYGDRVAVRSFCKKKSSWNKLSLIERLKNKSKKPELNASQNSTGRSKRSLKSTRMIEVGWMNSEGVAYKQVRLKQGGGTRKIPIAKRATCAEVLQKALSLFFPNGKSCLRKTEDFNIKLLDFKSHECKMDLTVQEIYDLSSLSTLRFYLGTTVRRVDTDIGKSNHHDTANTNGEAASSSGHETANKNYTNEDPEWFPEIALENLVTEVPSRTSERLAQGSLRNYVNEFNVEEEEPFREFYESFVDVSVPPQPLTPQNVMMLRRGYMFEDLLKAFQQNFFDDGLFKIEMILPSGERELAEDLGGVLRDALSEFWRDFYEKCTVGTSLKVPSIRHDFGEGEWKAIAKILCIGFRMERYFPIHLAPVFMKSCLQKDIEDEEQVTDFLNYLYESDRKILKEAQEKFDTNKLDEIMEVFQTYDSKWVPSEQNIRQLVREIAHQELIQKPAFIIKSFQDVFLGKSAQFENILDYYESLKPTVKNCLSKIRLEDVERLTGEQPNVFNFLRKFIKESDVETREAFFRFCTGSDLPIMTIKIAFNQTTGANRLPIGHTCSGLLELSSTYENFLVFRNEIKSVLNSNIWIMDMV